MKLKYLLIASLLSLSPVIAQERDSSADVEKKPVLLPPVAVDPEQVKQQKLENFIRSIINRCDPFPKCL